LAWVCRRFEGENFMSVKIRLARHGAKKRPFYRIVVADTKCPRDGKFLENVGTYNPLLDPAKVVLKQERIKYWIDQGAILTDTVKSLLKKEGFFVKLA
jgi:small subunit ribosomal protein S16